MRVAAQSTGDHRHAWLCRRPTFTNTDPLEFSHVMSEQASGFMLHVII